VSRLRERYRNEIVPAMMKEQGYDNMMQVPRLEKIVINVSLGEAIQNQRALEATVNDISLITGQRPVVTRAKKPIASFKLRAGMAIGVMTTLRGERMYEFFDRLVNAALPRVRDFHGVPRKAFDGRGNFTLGIKEQIIFPEIDYDKVDKIRGFQVSIITTARSDEEARVFLEHMGIPFSMQ
jgi:large subunit ribosomal protein L5